MNGVTSLKPPDLLRRGLRLEYLTISWNLAEAIVAIGFGIVAGSIALVGFGFDSTIEVFAASVVTWELRGVGEDREHLALRLIAISFFVLAAYVGLQAARDLWTQSEPHESAPGIVLAAVSLVVMPLLAIAKRRTGEPWAAPRSSPMLRRRCSARCSP